MSQLRNGYTEFGFAFLQYLSPDLYDVIFSAATGDFFHRYPMRRCKAMESPGESVAGAGENRW